MAGFRGWLLNGIPAHFIGYGMLAFAAAGVAGFNIWIGGPLDRRDDSPITTNNEDVTQSVRQVMRGVTNGRWLAVGGSTTLRFVSTEWLISVERHTIPIRGVVFLPNRKWWCQVVRAELCEFGHDRRHRDQWGLASPPTNALSPINRMIILNCELSQSPI